MVDSGIRKWPLQFGQATVIPANSGDSPTCWEQWGQATTSVIPLTIWSFAVSVAPELTGFTVDLLSFSTCCGL